VWGGGPRHNGPGWGGGLGLRGWGRALDQGSLRRDFFTSKEP
jgi:hypothetical protein